MFLLLSLACNPDQPGYPEADDSPPAATDDSEVGAVVPELMDVQAEITDVHTVARVSWTTDVPTTGSVSFGETAEHGLRTGTTELGTEHSVLLLGVPADTEIHFRVEVESEEGASAWSEELSITTLSLPSGIPELTVTGSTEQWAYQVVPLQGTVFVVGIIDNQGRYVWYDELPPGGNLMRAVLDYDRQGVTYMMAGPQSDLSQGKVVRVSLDGADRQEIDWPYVDHDMVELPDGTLGAIVVTDAPEGSDHDDGTADSIVEMAADGTTTVIWNAWEHLDFHDLDLGHEHNLTHGCALEYLPEDDDYLLSMKTLGTVARIDRATGQTEWLLNGLMNEFEFPEGTEVVQMQHQVQVVDGGLLIFDNGPMGRGYSRVVELALDEENKTAEQVWEYIRDPSVHVFAKGDVFRFDNGETQVVWSVSGEIQNVTPEGEVTWQLNTELGQAITFVQVVDDLYLR
jgi:hypothetical protein